MSRIENQAINGMKLNRKLTAIILQILGMTTVYVKAFFVISMQIESEYLLLKNYFTYIYVINKKYMVTGPV